MTPVWTSDTAVLSGPVGRLELATVPLDPRGRLREVRFDRATVTGLEVSLDEVGLTTLWSSFEDCTFRQRSRRLHRDGAEPQGSFGHRPCLYRRCTFVGVRFRLRAGFSVGEARFEDCVFERCRFSEHFSFDAEYVRCRFVGKMTMAVFNGVSPRTGRRNEIVDNDFTHTEFSDNVAWRGDFPVDDQRWPDGYRPPIRNL